MNEMEECREGCFTINIPGLSGLLAANKKKKNGSSWLSSSWRRDAFESCCDDGDNNVVEDQEEGRRVRGEHEQKNNDVATMTSCLRPPPLFATRRRTTDTTKRSSKSANKDADAAAQRWITSVDPRTGRKYYYRLDTRESQWTKPLDLCTPEEIMAIQEKEKRQKDFFRAMEDNIRTSLSRGSLPGEAASLLKTKKNKSSSMENLSSAATSATSSVSSSSSEDDIIDDGDRSDVVVAVPRSASFSSLSTCSGSSLGLLTGGNGSKKKRTSPPNNKVRTISSMDDTLLQALNKEERRGAAVMTTTTTTTPTDVAGFWRCEQKQHDKELGATSGCRNHHRDVEQDPKKKKQQDGGHRGKSRSVKFAPDVLSVIVSETTSSIEGPNSAGGWTRDLPGCCNALPSVGQPDKKKDDETSSSVSSTLPKPGHHRWNTEGRIDVPHTMVTPDVKANIKCVCGVYRAHILASSLDEGNNMDDVPSMSDTFDDSHNGPSNNKRRGLSAPTSSPPLPSLEDITSFFGGVFFRSKMEIDCIIVSLIYIERVIKSTDGTVRPTVRNWRSMLFSAMILSSKVWDDMSMWNVDFSSLRLGCGGSSRTTFSLQRVNQLELHLLNCLGYHVKVSTSEYAKYYFLMRSMLMRGGGGGGGAGRGGSNNKNGTTKGSSSAPVAPPVAAAVVEESNAGVILGGRKLNVESVKSLEAVSANYERLAMAVAKQRRTKSLSDDDMKVIDAAIHRAQQQQQQQQGHAKKSSRRELMVMHHGGGTTTKQARDEKTALRV